MTPSEDAAVIIHGGQAAWVVGEALWPWEPPHTSMGGVLLKEQEGWGRVGPEPQ